MRLLTVARDLQRRRGRERRALFVAEGIRAAEEVLRAEVAVKGALVTPELAKTTRGSDLQAKLGERHIEIAEVSMSELASASDTESSQGVLLIAEVPHRSLEALSLAATTRILVLDAVQDPGNVGTILRTAAAFGAAATVALPGTVDLWNPKVVRGAMGAHFRVPALHAESEELLGFLESKGIELWIADAGGESVDSVSPSPRLALAVGNEGAGVSPALRAAARRTVALSLAAGIESLNVAVATGILLYALRSAQGAA